MVRTFIYGSCVSRDTFEYIDKERFSLLRYVARSSLVSAFAPPTNTLPAGIDHLSSFQRRQVEDDFRSALPSVLAQFRESIDLVLWDLTDERLGLYVGSDGQVVTDSLELRRLGKGVMDEAWRHVPLASDEHFNHFLSALSQWRTFLNNHGLVAKLVLLAPPWASESVEGEPAPTSFGISADQANESYTRYHQAVRDTLGVPIIGRTLPVTTDKGHIWGAAPFHYNSSVYTTLIDEISDFVAKPK